MICHECDRPMRPSGRTIDEYPDTVRHSSRGLCQTCWYRVKRAHRMHEYPISMEQRPIKDRAPQVGELLKAGYSVNQIAERIKMTPRQVTRIKSAIDLLRVLMEERASEDQRSAA